MLDGKTLERELVRPITEEELIKAMPKQFRGKMPEGLVDTLNNISSNPLEAKNMRDNFISYMKVMEEGAFSIPEYINAVKYVSYKLMGYNNLESWSRVFPDRYARLLARNALDKDIHAHTAAYNKSKLVNLIYEQTLIPLHVLNQDTVQKAINVLTDVMINAKSDMAKVKAADSLLLHLKKPETKQIDLNIGVQSSDELEDMKEIMVSVAKQQKLLIEQGVSTKEVVHIPLVKHNEEIIDVEVEEVDE